MRLGKGLYSTLLIAYVMAFIILFLSVDGAQLTTVAAIATILSLILVPLFYFLDIRRTEQDEQTKTSKNLYGELKDTRDTLGIIHNPLSAANSKTIPP